MNKLTNLIVLSLLFVPLTVSGAGLVPCGGEGEAACQLCHLFEMAKNIIDFLLLPPSGLLFVIGTLLFIIAGMMYIVAKLFAPDSTNMLSQANKVMTSVVIGLVIVFGAWIFVNTFFAVIGVAEWTGLDQGWWTVSCPIE